MRSEFNDKTKRHEWILTGFHKFIYVWGALSVAFTAIMFIAGFISGYNDPYYY